MPRSPTGLMLVDNPRMLFTSLCLLEGRIFDRNEYRKTLASLTAKGSVDDKTRDTYLYLAHIFKLIEQTKSPRNGFAVTDIGKKICAVLNNPSCKDLYRQYIKGLILSNKDKGELFRHFFVFTSQAKKISEIRESFGNVPTKTLLAFGYEAGMLLRVGELVKSIEYRSDVSIGEFYNSLVKVYREIQNDPNRTCRIVYVPIDAMRDLVRLELGLELPEKFDQLLTQLLNSKEGTAVYLHGAAPQLATEFTGFNFKSRHYVYMSLRIEDIESG